MGFWGFGEQYVTERVTSQKVTYCYSSLGRLSFVSYSPWSTYGGCQASSRPSCMTSGWTRLPPPLGPRMPLRVPDWIQKSIHLDDLSDEWGPE